MCCSTGAQPEDGDLRRDPAIGTTASAIKLARSGTGNPEKPIGNFLFAGPTGVGKTEVTKQLALQLGIELVRFDMSEYMEPHSISRLIGAPQATSASTGWPADREDRQDAALRAAAG